MTSKFDRDFEEAVLSEALRDSDYLRKACRFLEPHHFGTEKHGWVWEVMRDTWVRYAERVTPRLMMAKAAEKWKDEEERAEALGLYRSILKLKPEAPKAILEDFHGYVRAVNLQAALEEAATRFEKGKINDAYDVLSTLQRRANHHVESTRIDFIEGFHDRMAHRKHLKEHPEEIKQYPTGIKKLDKIVGGLQVGELGSIMGTTGMGKSICLHNFMYTAAIKGHRGALFALEMPARQVAQRLDSRFTTLPYNKIKRYDLTPAELRQIDDRLKKMTKRLEGKLVVVSMPLRRCTIDVLNDEIDQLVATGFDPDLIGVDSGDHMRGIGKFDSLRVEQASVYWDLKNLAEERKKAVWTTTHAGREWADKKATAEAAAEAYDKSRIADLVFSINAPAKKTRSTRVVADDDDEAAEEALPPPTKGKYMEGFLAKYRDGESRTTIPLDAEFERMFVGDLAEGAGDE